MFNNFDDFAIFDNVIIKRKDCSVAGCYRDGIEIDLKQMTKEELNRAHLVARKHTAEIMGWER